MPRYVVLLTYKADAPAKNLQEIPPMLIEDYQHFDVPKRSFMSKIKVKKIIRSFLNRILRP